MKFWDASAIVTLLVAEPATRPAQMLAEHDPEMLVWWGSEVECSSALARLERAAALDVKAASLAFERLKQLAAGWHEIEPS
jgi:predicted nucleic acid-binding protein